MNGRPPQARVVFFAALLGLLAVGVAGCLSLRRGPASGAVASLGPGYAGTAACARCHAEEAAAHRLSGHSGTLQRVSSPLGASLKPSAWIRDPVLPLTFRVVRRDGVLGVEVKAGDVRRWQPATWLFGSGRHGLTLVADAGAGRYMELPLSFYPGRGWDLTPGYLRNAAMQRMYHPAGVPADHTLFSTCFACHGTDVGDGPADVNLAHMSDGVQCENCHGPAARHVQAAQSGQPAAGTIRDFRRAPAGEISQMCGQCHRTEPPPGFPPDAPQLVRFAPVGLGRSRCFRESGGQLSCLSCHNPHHDADGLPKRSEKVCLSCHAGAAHAGSGRPCPANPTSGCVNCHMPKAEAARNSVFTDHWIRPHRGGNAPAPAPPLAPGVTDH